MICISRKVLGTCNWIFSPKLIYVWNSEILMFWKLKTLSKISQTFLNLIPLFDFRLNIFDSRTSKYISFRQSLDTFTLKSNTKNWKKIASPQHNWFTAYVETGIIVVVVIEGSMAHVNRISWSLSNIVNKQLTRQSFRRSTICQTLLHCLENVFFIRNSSAIIRKITN